VAKSIELADLANELRKALADEKQFIEDNAETAVRVAAIKTFSKIIKMTPVDTGRARGNWFIGLDVGSELNAGKVRKGPAYVAKELPDTIMGKKTYLYNNLPYIEALEYGHSTQSPKGMVRVSLLNWNRTLKKAFKGLKWHT